MKCERANLDGYCALNKTKDECSICNRNTEIYESRKIASLVEKMNEETDVHELNRLYNEAEKMLYLVYGARFNYLILQKAREENDI